MLTTSLLLISSMGIIVLISTERSLDERKFSHKPEKKLLEKEKQSEPKSEQNAKNDKRIFDELYDEWKEATDYVFGW